MANEIYITAGLNPIDSSEDDPVVNTLYVTAGLIPDDIEADINPMREMPRGVCRGIMRGIN